MYVVEYMYVLPASPASLREREREREREARRERETDTVVPGFARSEKTHLGKSCRS
jgi:hypothetical protein